MLSVLITTHGVYLFPPQFSSLCHSGNGEGEGVSWVVPGLNQNDTKHRTRAPLQHPDQQELRLKDYGTIKVKLTLWIW